MSVSSAVLQFEAAKVRNAWLLPETEGGTPKLQWTGFRLSDEKQFFLALWTIVKAQSGAICYTRSTNNNLDYGGWFNYFIDQAKRFATGNDEIGAMIGRICSLLFDLKATGTRIGFAEDFPLALSGSFYGVMQRTPRGVPRAALGYLFEIGFEEASTTTAGDYFGQTLALKSNMGDGVALRSAKGEFVFAYRGDTRDLPSIIKQGARCRAELDFWRKNAGIDQAWHPWNSGDEKWKKMWFRKGNKDNDYFTMNSLAKDFHISCAYPMFKAFEVSPELKGPASGWDERKRAILARKNIRIATVWDRKANNWCEVPFDESRVFVCAITASTVSARTFELDDYPESAVRNVNLEDMVAWIKVRRYHKPPDNAESFYDSTSVDPSMTIKVLSWGWVRTEDETRASLGCTVSGIKAVGAGLQNLVGKTFDISHTTFYPRASYDVDRVKPTVPMGAVVHPRPKPVVLSTR